MKKCEKQKKNIKGIVKCDFARLRPFVQGGDFVFGNGSGGESVFGKRSFKDERAGLQLKHDRRGVTVDKGLRSVSNRKVYAIGDVAGGLQFTHVAGYHAGLVIRNALFRLPVTNREDIIPWVTYVDPEVANRNAFADQARLIEALGGERAVLESEEFDFTPVGS